MSRPNLPEPIIIGYTVGAVEGVEEIIEMPQAPSNYGAEAAEKWRKDPEKGAKAIAEAISQSSFCKVTGRLTSIFAVDALKGSIFDSRELSKSKKTKDLSPAVAFATWLLGERPNAFRSYPNRLGLDVNKVCLYGFHPKEFVRVLGIECQLAGYEVPIGLWYQNEDCFDPYDMVVEAERRKLLPLTSLLDCVGIARLEDYRQHQDPEEDARLTTELIHCFGLLAKYDEEKLYAIVQDNLTPIDVIEEEVDAEAAEAAEEEAEPEAEEEYEEEADAEAEGEEEYEEVEEEVEAESADEEYEEVEEEVEEEEVPPPPPAARRRTAKK